MDQIQAIYASTSGNVEMTVETVANNWREQGYAVDLHRSEVVNPEIISQNRVFLFATSTWDRGEINPFFIPILEKIAQTDCTGKAAFFIGCGDFRYEPVKFNMGIQEVHDVWKDKGGQIMFHPLKINGDPQLAMEPVILPWITKSLPHVQTLFEGEGQHE